jgi:hypothetical protein
VSDAVVIERRFNGPPASAQGGYACGLLGARLASCAEVSLRVPPPLERPLEVRRQGERLTLLDGETLVAEGGPAELELEVPAPISIEAAERASRASPWRDDHPFPTCFGCGPRRTQEEAIAIHMGPVEGRPGLFSGTWTPLAQFAQDGVVTPLFMWAALDCPTAAALPRGRPSVLARLTVRLQAPVRAGCPHPVLGWLIALDGRKCRGGAAIHTAGGELCGYSEGLWIALRDPATAGARVAHGTAPVSRAEGD